MSKKQKNKIQKPKDYKVVYYSDELNDDFAGTNIQAKKVTKHFNYRFHGIIWRAVSFLIYWVIAMPIVWFYEKVFLRVKFVNKKAMKKLKGKTCFMYGNHTGVIDAYTPNLLTNHRRNRIIVSPETVSIKGLKNIIQMLGAVPVPTTMSGLARFKKIIHKFHKSDHITIYPEAHIWPYYTGVRPFKDSSFHYPIQENAPVIAFFTAYTEPKGFLSKFRKANVTVYVSDPIYPDTSLPPKQAQKELRDKVYNFMADCSYKYSYYNVISYRKKESN